MVFSSAFRKTPKKTSLLCVPAKLALQRSDLLLFSGFFVKLQICVCAKMSVTSVARLVNITAENAKRSAMKSSQELQISRRFLKNFKIEYAKYIWQKFLAKL